MASSSTHEKLCEPCQQKKKKVKVRSFCFECQELLCKECSDIHLTFKLSRNHNLIDLIPLSKRPMKGNQNVPESTTYDNSAENSSDFVDDGLSSDFLENVTLTKDTVLYGAQVAIDHAVECSTDPSDLSTITTDPKRLKTKKILNFDAFQTGEDASKCIWGIVSLSDEVIVVALGNILNLFDQNGAYLVSESLRQVEVIFALTKVGNKEFAVCGTGNKIQLCTYDGKLREDKILNVDHRSHGITYNGSFFGVLHRTERLISVLDNEGNIVRKIDVSNVNGKKIDHGFTIHMDGATNNIFITCQLEGILCLSMEGEQLWLKPFPETYTLWDIIDLHNFMCIAHGTSNCLELMSKNGDYQGSLFKDHEMCSPECLYFCKRTNKLYIMHDRRQISIFTVEK